MKPTITIILVLFCSFIFGQKSFNEYSKVYPIGEDPNLRFMSSYTKQEKILFEANPIVRFSFYNNFLKGLLDEKKNHTEAWYISFRPQLRMYTDNSLPVRTPSYKALLGTQHLFRINNEISNSTKFWGFSLESGHYSNGQDGSAFSTLYADGSPESENIYNTINASTNLSEILNRRSGNFSTNLTELIINYRTYKLDEDNLPKQLHSLNIGYILYHNRFLGFGNFGGFSPNDIKLYGRHRLLLGYEFMMAFSKIENRRLSFKQNMELITNPHRSVNKVRSESILTFYPFPKSKALGYFITYIYGHDTYNYRFVDSGNQFSFGITWSQFPPFAMTNKL